MKKICVYCGSKTGNDPEYALAAVKLGQAIAERELGLVYGGGHMGLMGKIADAVLGAGGEVIGVIPKAQVDKGEAHQGLSELKIVPSMHERKAMMADLCDAFIAMPGGLGTLEEVLEVVTWNQLGLIDKPCALLNVNGYYDPLISFLDSSVNAGFIQPEHRQLLHCAERPDQLLDFIQASISQ